MSLTQSDPATPIDWERIKSPALILRESVVRANLDRMAKKAKALGLRLRPHFKTHQSIEIGEWFRSTGVESIAVSSVDMAAYFAQAGWADILIAFPVNLREHQRIDEIARICRLSVLLDSAETLDLLLDRAQEKLSIWLEIDVGDGRSGIGWQKENEILRLARRLASQDLHDWGGLMSHAGHSYAARGRAEVLEVHADAMQKINHVRQMLNENGLDVPNISVGDTPCCSLADNFEGATELRPGNFAFYDLMQENIGSCVEKDIAVGLACPVVARYPERGQLILHGGAVHLGKDFLLDSNGSRNYGRLAWPQGDGWGKSAPGCTLVSLSQEHGVAQVSQEMMEKVKVGDLLVALPVHSCLTADLMGEYYSAGSLAEGRTIRTLRARFAGDSNEFAEK